MVSYACDFSSLLFVCNIFGIIGWVETIDAAKIYKTTLPVRTDHKTFLGQIVPKDPPLPAT